MNICAPYKSQGQMFYGFMLLWFYFPFQSDFFLCVSVGIIYLMIKNRRIMLFMQISNDSFLS